MYGTCVEQSTKSKELSFRKTEKLQGNQVTETRGESHWNLLPKQVCAYHFLLSHFYILNSNSQKKEHISLVYQFNVPSKTRMLIPEPREKECISGMNSAWVLMCYILISAELDQLIICLELFVHTYKRTVCSCVCVHTLSFVSRNSVTIFLLFLWLYAIVIFQLLFGYTAFLLFISSSFLIYVFVFSLTFSPLILLVLNYFLTGF